MILIIYVIEKNPVCQVSAGKGQSMDQGAQQWDKKQQAETDDKKFHLNREKAFAVQ